MKTTLNYFPSIKSSMRPALRNTILSAALAVLGASCASAPPTIVREPVGPAFAVINEEHNGFLTVYSATEWTSGDDAPRQLTYSAYQIDAADGSLFREVPNGDQEPSRVILPKGSYTVVAESETSGTVRVPVIIETGRITVLHLEQERDWKASAGIRNADLVRLPSGQPIGFRARSAELLKGPTMTVAQSQHRSPVMGYIDMEKTK
jgi:hypothetical protein